jgi:hypothetical protein
LHITGALVLLTKLSADILDEVVRGRPIGVAGIAVKEEGVGAELGFKFLFGETNGLVVIVRANDVDLYGVHGPGSKN